MLKALAALSISLALACSLAPGATVSEPGWSVSSLATPGLTQPTMMRFLGADDFFVLEKASGKVKRYQSGVAGEVLDLDVNSTSERGLLGIKLHPDFPSTATVYLYYSAADGADGNAWVENRLSSFTWDGTSLSGESIVMRFPSNPQSGDGPNHDGGVLRFGPDGMLYGTTGDLGRDLAEQNNQAASNTSADVGGIFRLRPDGTVPDGTQGGETPNPFLAEANGDFHKWFAYGVRNSFGMAFDPMTGTLWDTENGPAEYDEINVVAAGFNSGWDAIMGPDSRDPQGTGDLVDLDSSAYSDPEFSWENPIGVTDIEFLSGSILGAGYDDAVLVGDVNLDRLYLLRLNVGRDGFDLSGDLADLVADSHSEADPLVVGSDFANPTDILIGPDDAVYVVSLADGAIYRIVPEPAAAGLVGLGGFVLLLRRRRK